MPPKKKEPKKKSNRWVSWALLLAQHMRACPLISWALRLMVCRPPWMSEEMYDLSQNLPKLQASTGG